jgi:hypothetical protein
MHSSCSITEYFNFNLHTFRGVFGERMASIRNNGLKNDSLSAAGGSCITNTSPLYSLNSEQTCMSTMKYTLYQSTILHIFMAKSKDSFFILLRTVFARSNTAIVASNPTGGMDVCVCSVYMHNKIL